MKNLKDTLTTICGVLGLICGVIVTLPLDGAIITPTLKTIAGAIASLSIAIIGFMSGKNPNGSTKVIDPATGQQDLDPNAVKE